QVHPIQLAKYLYTPGEILNRSIRVATQRGPSELGLLTFVVSGAFVNEDSRDVLVIIDLVQDFLRKRLAESETAQVFLIYRNGTLLSHPSLAATVAYSRSPYPHPITLRFAGRMLPRESFELDVDGEPHLCNIAETG